MLDPQLVAMQSVENLVLAINKMAMDITILKDERDEYRRKWLEEINNAKNSKQRGISS